MFNEEPVCKKCWNFEGDKTECSSVCKRREAYALNKPWYHIPPYGEIMEQKEKVTITAPIKEDPADAYVVVKVYPTCGIEGCEKSGNRRGLCTKHFDRWRKGHLEHPIEKEWKPNRKSSPRKKVKMFDKKTIQAIVQNLDAAVKSIEGRYNPQELHTVSEILDEEKRIEDRKETEGKIDWSCIPMETLDGVARVFQQGSVKYGGTRTWMPGIPFRKLCSAIVRHLVSWYWLKEDVDVESGESHLSHIIANSMMLLSFKDEKKFDDRPKG